MEVRWFWVGTAVTGTVVAGVFAEYRSCLTDSQHRGVTGLQSGEVFKDSMKMHTKRLSVLISGGFLVSSYYSSFSRFIFLPFSCYCSSFSCFTFFLFLVTILPFFPVLLFFLFLFYYIPFSSFTVLPFPSFTVLPFSSFTVLPFPLLLSFLFLFYCPSFSSFTILLFPLLLFFLFLVTILPFLFLLFFLFLFYFSASFSSIDLLGKENCMDVLFHRSPFVIKFQFVLSSWRRRWPNPIVFFTMTYIDGRGSSQSAQNGLPELRCASRQL